MSRPANKSQLTSESYKEYQSLEQFLAGLNAEQMVRPGALGAHRDAQESKSG